MTRQLRLRIAFLQATESEMDLERQNDTLLRELAFAIESARGQFKLMFARCNYDALRSHLLEKLRNLISVDILELRLSPDACSLFHAVKAATETQPPAVLSVSGLDDIANRDRLLQATNPVREEFRKRFQFPLLLWANDELLAQLVRQVPDFESWGITYEFSLSAPQILHWIEARTERAFHTVLQASSTQLLAVASGFDDRDRKELRSALQTLQKQKVSLEPSLRASVEFLVGRHAYDRDRLDTAHQYFDRSLNYWNHQPHDRSLLEKRAVVSLHLGLVHLRHCDATETEERLSHAKTALQQSLESFDRAGRQDCTAGPVTLLEEILDRLGQWTELKALAHRALTLHQTHGVPLQQAIDYRFLAKVAALEERWHRAHLWVDKAMQVMVMQKRAAPNDPAPYQALLTQQFRLDLVTTQKHLNQYDRARDNLDCALKELPEALRDPSHQLDPQRYLRWLDTLKNSYRGHRQYLAAFHLKQHQRSIEQQYGFRAFIGAGQLQPQRQTLNLRRPHNQEPRERIAPEILASPRQFDIDRLVERIARPDRKLIVLYGPSGVGKSSLVDAGLVPALHQSTLASREVLPVVLRVYSQWRDRLARQLYTALVQANAKSLALKYLAPTQETHLEQLLETLTAIVDRNRIVVLIFDQFEEFFFVRPPNPYRRLFYEFLDRCFNIPYVKVVLSLREDYLHYLLECDRQIPIDAIANDILNKNHRYYLSNFSPDDTRHLIRHLTATRPHLELENALIDELVGDLSRETGDVRPIELQIVGASLQEDNITTLNKYRQLGTHPKQELVERFLEDALCDCGAENEDIARHILYSLTDKHGNRPIKSYGELVRDLSGQADTLDSTFKSVLDLILEIFVKSGLVSLLPEVPNNRYQLVHDYLVPFIRQHRERADSQAVADLRAQNQKLSREKNILQQLTLAQKRQRQSDTRLKRFLVAGAVVSLLGTVTLGIFANVAQRERRNAAIAEIEARNAAAVSPSTPDSFAALLQSLYAASKIQRLNPPPDLSLQSDTVRNLQQNLDAARERNRLEGHRNSVVDVSFSADGSFIATASWDDTVRLWHGNGELMAVLAGHEKPVNSVSISPDGTLIASGSSDGTVKLWNRDGRLVNTLTPGAMVTSVAFSPDGEVLAATGDDGTVQLWTAAGERLNRWTGHDGFVLAMTFDREGTTLWTAGSDRIAVAWTLEGTEIQRLNGHQGEVTGISLDSDGSIATVSTDKTLKLWNADGSLSRSIPTADLLFDVSFSPDGTALATTGEDRTVKLWNRDGSLQQTLAGHRNRVWAVSFSPTEDLLATASTDTTVRLWQRENLRRSTLADHVATVWAVSFSPTEDLVATASADKTVKIWNLDGTLRQTLNGHQDRVHSIAFSGDGRQFVTASADGTARLWKVGEAESARVFNHPDSVKSASFSPDGTFLATASRDGSIVIWRVSDGVRVRTIAAHAEQVNAVMWSPDGKTLLSASDDRTFALWSFEGALLQRVETPSAVYWATFDPKGEVIATASKDNTVKFWNREGVHLQTFEGKTALEGHTAPVNWVSFSPDGNLLASVGNDRTVKLWQPDGTLVTEFEAHNDSILSVSFHPKGHLFATASKDGTAKLWLLPEGDNLQSLLEQGCGWVRDYLQTNPRLLDRDRNLCDLP
ncbi:AAA family ATPase [Baaleninema sp.]|uniref:WD40 domain-containing protein n=1 Tax=Baaleninema sp. TaxID=3101197 RepID=UPI003D00220A